MVNARCVYLTRRVLAQLSRLSVPVLKQISLPARLAITGRFHDPRMPVCTLRRGDRKHRANFLGSAVGKAILTEMCCRPGNALRAPAARPTRMRRMIRRRSST
jgi:hypothetical protein